MLCKVRGGGGGGQNEACLCSQQELITNLKKIGLSSFLYLGIQLKESQPGVSYKPGVSDKPGVSY